jgi:hypothetical protein
MSNSLFDVMFLSLKTQDIKNFYAILKIMIRFICCGKNDEHKEIFKMLKNDKDIEVIIRNDFSANLIVKILNKVMSLENVKVKQTAYTLFLSAMSGIQTIEYVNDNKPLTILTRVYMDKSIKIE